MKKTVYTLITFIAIGVSLMAQNKVLNRQKVEMQDVDVVDFKIMNDGNIVFTHNGESDKPVLFEKCGNAIISDNWWSKSGLTFNKSGTVKRNEEVIDTSAKFHLRHSEFRLFAEYEGVYFTLVFASGIPDSMFSYSDGILGFGEGLSKLPWTLGGDNHILDYYPVKQFTSLGLDVYNNCLWYMCKDVNLPNCHSKIRQYDLKTGMLVKEHPVELLDIVGLIVNEDGCTVYSKTKKEIITFILND